MSQIVGVTPPYFRGATLRFQTTFYDFDGAVVQPNSATLVVFSYDENDPEGIQQQIPMTAPPVGETVWTAYLDTRNMTAPRRLQWSIFTPAPIPSAVEDGYLDLVANDANQLTF